MASIKLTKAQLLARIDELEEQCGVKDAAIELLKQDVQAYLVAERPSRGASRSHDFQPTTTGIRIERRGQCVIKRYPARAN